MPPVKRILATFQRYCLLIMGCAYLAGLLTVLLGARFDRAELIVLCAAGALLDGIAHAQAEAIRVLAIAAGRHVRGRIQPGQIPAQRAAHPAYRDWR